MLLAHHLLVEAGALHIGLKASPQTLGIDMAGINSVDLNTVELAAIGQRLGKGNAGRIDRAADGEIGARKPRAGARDGDQGAGAFLEQRPRRTSETHMAEKL